MFSAMLPTTCTSFNVGTSVLRQEGNILDLALVQLDLSFCTRIKSGLSAVPFISSVRFSSSTPLFVSYGSWINAINRSHLQNWGMFISTENRNEKGFFICVWCVCVFLFGQLQSSWMCQLAFCTSLLNNALCFVTKPPLGSFYGRFLLEEDISPCWRSYSSLPSFRKCGNSWPLTF